MKAKDIEQGRTIILSEDETAYVVHAEEKNGGVEFICLRNNAPFMITADRNEDIPVPRGRPRADA